MIKTRSLPVRLSREERELRASQLTETIAKYDQVDGERKAAAAGYKTQIDRLNDEIRKLAGAVRSGLEHRDVEIEERPTSDFTINIYRVDSGDLVDTRSMTDSERDRYAQAVLFARSEKTTEPKPH